MPCFRQPFLTRRQRLVVLLLVLLAHAGMVGLAVRYRVEPVAVASGQPMYVHFVAPPSPVLPEQRTPEPPRPKPLVKRRSAEPVAMVAKSLPQPEAAAEQADSKPPPSSSAPSAETEMPTQVPLPVAPVVMTSELALACKDRPAPAYPPVSRRLGEQGLVVVRVDLDERGHVVSVQVDRSSGHPQLDAAALEVIRAWRCAPPTRNGVAARAVALQPFNFVLSN